MRGNVIGDEGIALISTAIKEAPSLTELDISLNEIGPQGF